MLIVVAGNCIVAFIGKNYKRSVINNIRDARKCDRSLVCIYVCIGLNFQAAQAYRPVYAKIYYLLSELFVWLLNLSGNSIISTIKELKIKLKTELKHTNSILKYFEYFCMSSNLSLSFLSYIILKLVRFLSVYSL